MVVTPLQSPPDGAPENAHTARREARVEIRVPVTVYRAKKAISLVTLDVSFKGLFVCTDDPPPLRSLVKLRVCLAGREFEAHAMAVHVVAPGTSQDRGTLGAHEPGVGLQFWGLSGQDRAAWDDFVRSLVHSRPAANSGIRIVVTRTLASSK